jgi:hypothetical protein
MQPEIFNRRGDDAPQEGEGTMKILSLFGRLALVTLGVFLAGTGLAVMAGQFELAILGALLAAGAWTLADHDAEFCASRQSRAVQSRQVPARKVQSW